MKRRSTPKRGFFKRKRQDRASPRMQRRNKRLKALYIEEIDVWRAHSRFESLNRRLKCLRRMVQLQKRLVRILKNLDR